MLLSFNVDPTSELKISMRKARKERLSKRSLKILAENRSDRYERSSSIKEFVADLLDDCVEAVSKHELRSGVESPQSIERKVEQKGPQERKLP